MVVELAREFAKEGMEVHVVLMALRGRYLHLVPEGVQLVDLKCNRLWTSLPRFMVYADRARPDAIVASMPLANSFAAMAKVLVRKPPKILLTEHNSRSVALDPQTGLGSAGILHRLCRMSYPRADALIGVSVGVKNRLLAEYPNAGGRVHAICNPALPPESPSEVGPPPHPWLAEEGLHCCVTVGRLVPQKDHQLLIRAIARLRSEREVRLIIVGEGEERRRLTTLIEELRLHDVVDLVGFRHDRLAFMRWADVFVLSSVHEGFGNVLVEAMAMQTQVVSTDCPSGPSEILGGGRFGRLVPVGDAAALGRAIRDALDHPLDPGLMRRRAESFSPERAAADYLKLIEGLLSPKATGAA